MGQIIPLPTFCEGHSLECTCAAEANVVRFHCPDEYAMLLEVSEPGASLYLSYYASGELKWLPRFNISEVVKIEFDAYSFWPETFLADLLETLGVKKVKTVLFRDRTSETVVTRDVLNATDGYQGSSPAGNISTWHFGAFPGLQKFKFYSAVEDLMESTFHKFDCLTELLLHVEVKELPGNLLSTVKGTLEALIIESPVMISFKDPLLRELQQLRNLSILLTDPQRGRDQLQPHFFGAMKNLEEVRLAQATGRVDRKMFKGTEKLKLIKMNGNDDLTQLPGEIFEDQVSLVTLDLSCNAISKLHNDVFKGLANLTILDLAKNN
uniref:Uncharacterized protein LOC108047048 n=1 Tax=Drosophila rhopaloa TaxID=1041015 RepID=A0A6P4EWP6_DRORH